MQRHEAAARLGQQQYPGGFAIEAVRKFQKRLLRAGGTCALDHAVRYPTAAVCRNARRFVQDKKMLILVQDAGQHCRRHHPDIGRGQAHRWNAQFVAGGKPIFGRGTTAVDAHLTAAHDAVDMALRNPLGQAQQEIIQSLARLLGPDDELAHGRRRGLGRGTAGGRGRARGRAGTSNCGRRTALPLASRRRTRFALRNHVAYTGAS